MRKVVTQGVFLLIWASLATLAFAQATDGNLVGTITDPTGAVIPNASIQLLNAETGVGFTAKVDDSGNYRFNNIAVGLYTLRASAGGFTTATLKNIAIQLNKTTTANVSLEVGTVTTTLEVAEAPATIDTTTAQVQSTFESKQIVNLPIIETSGAMFGALNLSLLSAGVASNGGVGQGVGPSIGGQRPMNNNYTIEGVDNNNKAVTGPLVYVPTEATAEFTLLQNQFAPEFGHSSGGQFNTIVKSGTNALHGSVYEYFQNRNLNSLDESFARQGIREIPRFDQNRVGGSVGGPIKKNKLFYFGNFEYAPLGQAYTLSPPVSAPTAEGFAKLATIPGLSQTNLSVFKQFVAPAPVANDVTTVKGIDIPIGILPVSGSYFTNQYTGVASADYNMSERDQLRGRFVYNRIDQLDNLANLPAFWTNLPQRFYLLSLGQFHTFNPNLTNELRLAYNRFSQYYIVPSYQFPGLDRFPNITFDNDLGLQLGPDSNAPQYTVQNTYELVENLSWTKSKHTLKFGFDGRNLISPQHFIQRERGDYNYPNLEAYLLDQVPDDLAERNLGDTTYYGNQWALYFYGNDNWRLRPNLSLNLGLRYEYTTVPLTQGLQSLNHIADVPGVLVFNSPKAATRNWAPRIGIAYSPGRSGNTSIRAGFGMAYDVIFDNVGSTAYPPQLSATFDAGDYPNLFKAPFLAKGGIFPGSIAAGGNLTQDEARAATSSFLPDQVLPYSIQWNFGVQHVFAKDYTLEVRYLGTRGVHLLVQNQMDRVAPVTADRNLPTYLQMPSQAQLNSLPLTLAALQNISSNPTLGPYGFSSKITWWPPIGNSLYNGMAVQLNRRFSRGMQLVGSYTWSHNLDDSTATHFSTVLTPRREQDFINLRPDWATSALDRRQRLTLSWIWETPWYSHASSWLAKNLLGNWRWVGTYTAESPEYATAQSGTDSNLNGDTAGDRTIINPAGDPNKGSGVTALTNSAGDIVAYLANDPTARYILAGKGAYANGGRNTLATRGINNFDMSFGKRFSIREHKAFEFRGDFSNFFNHPQFTPGYVNSVRLTSQTNTRDFMVPGNRTFGAWDQVFPSNARTIQLVARITF